jgi:hypothetical protein
MANGRGAVPWVTLAAALASGCGGDAEPAPGTGAREAARGYYEALVRRDWAAARAALHFDSRARCGPEEFARRAGAYRQRIGFEPQEVRLRSCEEQGGQAIAHVVLTGHAGGKQRSFRDAVTLRKVGSGWGVVLPPRFGQPR